MFGFVGFVRLINVVQEKMDKSAFEQKARTWREKAVSVSLHCGAGKEEAEDIAQDVMLKLWCLHEKICDVVRMNALVSITTKHVCIDRWRTMHIHEDMGKTTPIVDEDTMYDHLEYAELEQWMGKQINFLPTTSRIVLTMRQLEHRELSEIADILGIKQTSVSTLLARARNELMNKLKRRN